MVGLEGTRRREDIVDKNGLGFRLCMKCLLYMFNSYLHLTVG